MNTIGYLGSATLALGCAAYAAIASAKRFERIFPAPANDVPGTHGGAAAARLPHGVSMTAMALRQGLPELPQRMRALPLDSRGYPVPVFAQRDSGVPDYRRCDSEKLAACVYYKRCCVCGEPVGQYKAFMIDALSAVTRTSLLPPAHIECAKFVAKACPVIEQRVGVSLVWVTRAYEALQHESGLIFRMAEAEQTCWYINGRRANRDEVRSSFEDSLPALYDAAHAKSEAAVFELDTMVARATRYFPAHSAAAFR
ncbi:hypothetical protein G3N59_01095 [Paraburkholderia sp. Ac-20340]|uniref:hypothetical protein n=1 Tax=Paraburkholderia sp. Ac-20340 TaxID=2703888 RepID=UPI00197F098F|nr:hypothetical protein [Paraburkholderia sp. Ac-20340]MBN3851963.1 hypothetical protein [Paraburkholderia sp. Ac-20340]